MKGLDDLYLFHQVVECGGIAAAARAQGLPKSTLARRIAMLEDRLGTPLFHRGPRRLVLTNFGRECHAQCVKLAQEAERIFAMAERVSEALCGSLHVVCPPQLGQLVLEAIAMDFLADAPGVRLHLEETNTILDPRRISADFVFHASFEPLSNVDVVARRVLHSPYALVAASAYVEGRPPVKHPQDLRAWDGIGLGSKGHAWSWRLSRGRERVVVPFTPRVSTSELSAALAAVRRGLGLAALPLPLCEADLRAGRLLHVLPQWAPSPVNVYALYPSGRTLTMAARQFLSLVERELPRRLQHAGLQEAVE